MEIVTRQQAIKGRLHKYYTGVPCRNGHLAQRYTYNSVCLECVHPKIESPLGIERAQKNEQRIARLKGIGRLIRAKFRIKNSDFTAFRTAMEGLALMQCPALRPEDLNSKAKPFYGSVFSIHPFRVFPEMVPLLRSLEYQANQRTGIRPPTITAPAQEWPEHDPR